MSSTSKVYGITPFSWIPSPDFRAGFDDKGFWTGSQTFSCRKFDFDSTPIQTAFQKGKSVTTLYPNLSAKWNFLTVSDVTHEHEAGGITKIYVNYSGYSADWEFDANETADSGTFAFTASEAEAPLTTHPKFMQLDAAARQLIGEVLRGEMKVDKREARTSSQIYFCDQLDDNGTSINSEDGVKWFERICDRRETWLTSQLEWTHSATNQGGVPNGTLLKFGWIDPAPDGDPPGIAGRNWRMTGITDSQTIQGGLTTSEYSITWTMSPPGIEWDEFIYTKPE